MESIAASSDGWKPREVEDEVCLPDRPDVFAGELEVVRLDARRGEVAHVDPGATDLLSGERERVEGSDDATARPQLESPPQPASPASER